MTEEELEAKMKQILHDYSPILEGKIDEIKKKVKEMPTTKPLEKLQPLNKTEPVSD